MIATCIVLVMWIMSKRLRDTTPGEFYYPAPILMTEKERDALLAYQKMKALEPRKPAALSAWLGHYND